MQRPQTPSRPVSDIGALEAIYLRRGVRDYMPARIDRATIERLLDAAVHAPTAMDQEPCRFLIVQDKPLLDRLSGAIKALLAASGDPIHPHGSAQAHDRFTAKSFNAFYNAGTLVVVCANAAAPFAAADCWLAAENLMLAACAMGLGTCPIGLAVTALNGETWKRELGIPTGIVAIAPIIVGEPAGKTAAVPRKRPEILAWI